MLNQPTNIIPSTLSGVGAGVIDATQGLTVSWDVTGDSPMTSYQIQIYSNANNVLLYTFSAGSVTPFYGKDENGEQRTFTAPTISASTLASNSITNGNTYKLIITQWWGVTDRESVRQTSASLFYARENPTLSLIVPNSVNTNSVTVTANFSQANGDTVSLVRWVVTNTDTYPSTVTSDTGYISTSVLSHSINGLIDGYHYNVSLTVITSSGVTKTRSGSFSVNYEITKDLVAVKTCVNKWTPYVGLHWDMISEVEPELDNASVANSMLYLSNANSYAEYSPMYLQEEWSAVWAGYVTIPDNDAHNILRLRNTNTDPEIYFNLNVSASYVEVRSTAGNIIFTESMSLHTADYLIVIFTPTRYYIKHVSGDIVERFSGSTVYTYSLQKAITNVTLRYIQRCNYFWIIYGEIDSENVRSLLYQPYYAPSWDDETLLLATFDDESANADMRGSYGVSYGSSVYRQKDGEVLLQHIADSNGSFTELHDYSALPNTRYKYFVYEKNGNVFDRVFESAEITPFYNQYCLMDCIYNSTEGVYHVQAEYPFACNVTNNGLSNNSNPSILQNFTRYPTRQQTTHNYKSGTLSALIGSADQTSGTYSDSWELANKIYALSVNGNPKFLRDLKGELWRIDTSAAITGDINMKSQYMPITITIPWVEVGSAEGVSIVSTPNDPSYQRE